jgi:hypothetical protein
MSGTVAVAFVHVCAPFEVHGLYDVSGATPIMGVDVRTTGATMEGRATTEASIIAERSCGRAE